jgi:hypothetical protein
MMLYGPQSGHFLRNLKQIKAMKSDPAAGKACKAKTAQVCFYIPLPQEGL